MQASLNLSHKMAKCRVDRKTGETDISIELTLHKATEINSQQIIEIDTGKEGKRHNPNPNPNQRNPNPNPNPNWITLTLTLTLREHNPKRANPKS